MARREPHALDRCPAVDRAEQRRKVDQPRGVRGSGGLDLEQGAPAAGSEPAGPIREALPVGVHVLAEQGDLAITRPRELLDLVEDLVDRPRDFLTPSRRDDAVRALLVAAFHDRDECRDAAPAVVGRRPAVERPHLPVDGEDVRPPAEAGALAPLGDPGQEVGEVVDLRRPCHEVHLREAAEDILALRLGHAAQDAEDQVGALALELLHEAHLPDRPLLGVCAHRAGVQENEVRVFLAVDHDIALGGEHPEDLLGVPFVHLAAVSLQVDRLGHGGPIVHLSRRDRSGCGGCGGLCCPP